MAEKISTKLEIDGAKEYTQGVAEANSALRVLRSELKADQSAMDGTASAMDKARNKQQNLNKQYEQQKKIVEASRKRLDELTKQYPKGGAAVDQMRVKLNNSITAMNKTRSEIDKVNAELVEMESAGDKAQDGLDDLEKELKNLENQTANTGSALSEGLLKNLAFNQAVEKFKTFGGAVKGILEGIADVAQNIVTNIAGIVREVSAGADEIATLAQTSGLSVDTLLSLRAAERAGYDISMDAFASAATKLSTSRTGSAFSKGKYNKKTKSWEGRGMFYNITADNPNISNEDLLWRILSEASMRYKPGGNNEELDAAMQAAFGKSFADFRTYLSDGGVGLMELTKQLDAEGLVRNEDQNTVLASIDDVLQKMHAIIESIKELIVLNIAPHVQNIVTTINSLLSDVNGFLNALQNGDDTNPYIQSFATHAEAFINQISTAVQAALEAFWGVVEGMAANDPDSETFLGGLANTLLNIRDWFNNTWPGVWEKMTALFDALYVVLSNIAGFFNGRLSKEANEIIDSDVTQNQVNDLAMQELEWIMSGGDFEEGAVKISGAADTMAEMPEALEKTVTAAVEKGVAKIGGWGVYLDGASVGRMVNNYIGASTTGAFFRIANG